MEFVFDLTYSPTNKLYKGVKAHSKNGRWAIVRSQETVNAIISNAESLALKTSAKVAIITGGAPVWAYAALASTIGWMFQEVKARDANGLELTVKHCAT